MMLAVFLQWLLLATLVSADQLITDNSVIEPKVVCDSDSMMLKFKTRNAFKGNVFVRDHFSDLNCSKSYQDSADSEGELRISFAKCGMRRLRQQEPRGMTETTTVVVMFHRTFITKADVAYHLSCFYREDIRLVTQTLEVSELAVIGQEDVAVLSPMPDCKYEVLTNVDSTEHVRFAQVGDKIYHKWSCNHAVTGEMYCMRVHSCTVDDGEVTPLELVDALGCSKDPTILDTPLYIGDMMVGVESSVFKFADKPRVHFSCQVQLSLKKEHGGDSCPKPDCQAIALNRFRFRYHRQRRELLAEQSFDVIAEPILVFDVDDLQPEAAHNRSKAVDVLPAQNVPSTLFAKNEKMADGKTICVSYVVVNLTMAAVFIWICLLLIIAGAFLRRSKFCQSDVAAQNLKY